MKVRLCTFTRAGIESELGSDLSAAVLTALRHYSDKLRSGRPPVEPPHFIVSDEVREDGEVMELALEPEVEEVLVGEAARQGIDLEALAAHSLHVYLAELDFLAVPIRLV
jgi:predicted HicB family RNase H-like nuclease